MDRIIHKKSPYATRYCRIGVLKMLHDVAKGAPLSFAGQRVAPLRPAAATRCQGPWHKPTKNGPSRSQGQAMKACPVVAGSAATEPIIAAWSGARARTYASLLEFQSWFPDEASCTLFLLEQWWPDGLACLECAGVDQLPMKLGQGTKLMPSH